jgi:hypothetical protein
VIFGLNGFLSAGTVTGDDVPLIGELLGARDVGGVDGGCLEYGISLDSNNPVDVIDDIPRLANRGRRKKSTGR